MFSERFPFTNLHARKNDDDARRILVGGHTTRSERHRQGLCFNCDEKFFRGHKCAHLFFIEYDDSTPDNTDWGNDAVGDNEPRISLYVVAGVKTVERCASVYASENTSYWLSWSPARLTTSFAMTSRLTWVLRCSRCGALDVVVGAEPFQIKCFSLALDGYDIILCTHLLRTLRPILWDFSLLSMTCFIGGSRMTW